MSRIFDPEKLKVYRAALDVLVAKKRCVQEEVTAGKDHLWSTVSMLVGLIRSNSDYRMHEGKLEQGLRLRLRLRAGQVGQSEQNEMHHSQPRMPEGGNPEFRGTQ